MPDYEAKLKELLSEDREVIVIAGAGLSIGAVDGQKVGDHNVASWQGLLLHGVDFAWQDDKDRHGRRRADIESGDTDEMIHAAGLLTNALGGRESGKYRSWLNDTIGSLRATKTDAIEALLALRAPIATTNYDNLIEDVARRDRFITWQDGTRWQTMIRGQEKAVLHLHGHYLNPSSVILGVESYDEVMSDTRAQAMLQGLALTRTFLFVGMGAGLEDPNFGALRKWLKGVAGDSNYPHYRLIHATEEVERDSSERIEYVVYGPSHDALPDFLHRIAPDPVAEAPESGPPILEIRIGRDKVEAVAPSASKAVEADLRLDDVRVSMVQLLEGLLRRRDDALAGGGPEDPEEAKLLGRILYEAVFHGEIKTAFQQELLAVQGREGPDRLALVLKVQKEQVASLDGGPGAWLHELPWELLSSSEEGWLAAHPSLAVFRALYGVPDLSATQHQALRVLVINAQPADVLTAAREPWDQSKRKTYDKAMTKITRLLNSLRSSKSVASVQVLKKPTYDAVDKALKAQPPPNIIHYVGYEAIDGMQKRWVALHDPQDKADWVSSEDFTGLFRQARPKIVFLHLIEGPREPLASRIFARSSFTELAVQLLSGNVELVVAMQYPMSPDIGLKFTETFYAGIENPGDAVHNARQEASRTFYRLGAAVLYLHDASLVTVNGKEKLGKTPPKSTVAVSNRDDKVRGAEERTSKPGKRRPQAADAGGTAAPRVPAAGGLTAPQFMWKAYVVAQQLNQNPDSFSELARQLHAELGPGASDTIEPVALAAAARDRADEARPDEVPEMWRKLSAELEPRPATDLWGADAS